MSRVVFERTCRKCFVTLPATPEHFRRNPDSPDGLRSECKTCSRTADLARREVHLERLKEYYEDNRTRILSRMVQYYRDNAEDRKAYQREYDKTKKGM